MTNTTSTVSISACREYDLDQIRPAVSACLLDLPALCDRLSSGRKVLLKPNLLSSRSGPDQPVNTHPSVVQAVAELVISDFSCDVAIGDSCGSLTRSSTRRAIEKSGMEEVAHRTGAEIYNVDQQPREVVPFADGEIFKEIPLPSNLDQFDLIISLAKLKTHHLTALTCTVKNMLGLVPGAAKKKAHLMAPRTDEFAALLCDLYACLQPDAGLVDGVLAMEGGGPSNGDPRPMNMIAASCDSFALDSICARVMDMDPSSVLTLKQGADRKLGRIEPNDIEVTGEPVENFVCSDFQPASSATNDFLLRICPRWLFRRFFESATSLRAIIDQDACIQCGECARNCPSHAISFDDSAEQFRVDPDLCISCYCCDEVCPADAIRMNRGGILGRLVDKLSGSE